jgi:hypothetical protein
MEKESLLKATQIILDGLLTHLEMLTDECDDPRLDELIDQLDEANSLAGEMQKEAE